MGKTISHAISVNDTFACENNNTLNGLLKGELGFQGYVMSDWYATHSTAAAANNGLDVRFIVFTSIILADNSTKMTMPGDIIPGIEFIR